MVVAREKIMLNAHKLNLSLSKFSSHIPTLLVLVTNNLIVFFETTVI